MKIRCKKCKGPIYERRVRKPTGATAEIAKFFGGVVIEYHCKKHGVLNSSVDWEVVK
jgi:hypothetical protein